MNTLFKTSLQFIAVFSLSTSHIAIAQDNPNAAIEAETARINAEAAKTNAEAALASAKAQKEKAAIENLGLPKFENKTTLSEGGGAIETSMLATRAVQAAAEKIKDKLPNATPCTGKLVILAAGQEFDPNLDSTIELQANYLLGQYQQNDGSRPAGITAATGIAIGTAVAGLAGNEVKVTGVALTEIDSNMLANAVAGQLGDCAYLPSSGSPKIDPTNSEIAKAVSALVTSRRSANAWVATLDKDGKKSNATAIALISELNKEFAAFDKTISAVNDQGVSLRTRAMVVEKMKNQAAYAVTIKVNKAGGTITNSKNLGTFFGADPVRVSGGLTASWTIMDLNTGLSAGSGVVSCQTAQVRLSKVQSGDWTRVKDQAQTAFCKTE